MGFLEWLTGRNGIYEDETAIKEAKDALSKIASNDLDDVKSEISAAVNQLNSVTGFAEEVGQLNSNAFDSVIDCGADAITAIVSQIDGKVQDIEEFSSASLPTKIFSTIGMGAAKIGEGFVGAFEDVGDALLTAGAWVCNIPKLWTGEDTAASKVLQSAVEYDVSHNMFDALVYSKDWTKYSAITEDSGAASVLRGVGQAAGYLTMGGYLAGANEALAGAGKLGKVSTVLKSTTNANTLVAAVGGFGGGTEAGLQSGLGLEAASAVGAKEAVVQGAMTYAAGKIGEHQMVKNGMSVADAKAAGGFTDSLTMAAKQHGYNSTTNVLNAIQNASGSVAASTAKGVLIGTGQNLAGDAKSVVSGIKKAGSSTLGVVTHPVNTAKTVLSTAKNIVTHPVSSVKTATTTVASATKTGVSVAAAHAGTTALVAANALKDPVADAINSATGDSLPTGLVLSENRTAANYSAMIDESLKANQIINSNQTAIPSTQDSSVFSQTITDSGIQDGDSSNNGETENNSENSNSGNINGGNTSSGTTSSGNSSSGYSSSGNTSSGNSNSGSSSSGSAYIGNNDNGNTNNNNGTNNQNNNNEQNNGNNNQNNNGNSQNNNNSQNNSNNNQNNNNEQNNSNNEQNNGDNNQNNNNSNGNSNNNNNGNNNSNNNNNNERPSNNNNSNSNNNNGNNQSSSSNSNNGSSSGGMQHSGGGYSSNGSTTSTSGTTTSITGTAELEGSEKLDPIDEALEEANSSIDDIIKGSKYSKIPSSTTPVQTQKSSGSSSVIPIAAGLSAAAAAGIGAKAYMDHKKNNETGDEDDEYEDDDFATDDWDTDNWDADEDTLDLTSETSNDDGLLSDDDAYTYQESEEKYEARSSQELADLQ